MSGLETWSTSLHSFNLPLRHHLSGPEGAGVVICLHGYQDHALSMLRRLGWLNKNDLPFRVLAINAPFPVPIWGAEGFTEAYAWYFRDTTRGIEVGSPRAVATAIADLARTLGVIDRPTVVFGFSQGGFLAPAVAREFSDARAVICHGGGYPADLYADLPKTLKLFGLHGDVDERVPIGPARIEFEQILANGLSGEFFAIEGLGHKVTPKIEPLVTKLARAALES